MTARRALLSVYRKDGVVDLARGLTERGFEILSTGGTAAELKKAKVKVTGVSKATGFPEILDGRAVTLTLEARTGNCSRLLGRVSIPELSARMRVDELPKAQRLLLDAIEAYTSRDPIGYRDALGDLLHSNGVWRTLTPWQNLWLSAMTAELARRPATFRRYGCSALSGHPQLLCVID